MTRKPLWVPLAIATLFLAACALFSPKPSMPSFPGGVIVLEAQSLPITKTLAWVAPATGVVPDNYVVMQDGVQIGTPTGLTQSITITTPGSHTWTIQSNSTLWGLGGTATLTELVEVPGAPTGAVIR